MKRPSIAAVALLVLLGGALARPARAESEEEARIRRAIGLARDRVYPALVNIAVITRDYQQGRAVRYPSAGSGVIVSPAGHVLTNYHVAANATRLTCTLPGGERIDADVVTHDPLTDLSVLKLRLDQRPDPTVAIPFAAIGDSDALAVGDYVLAMGNPRSMSSSVTLGIVANVNRVFKSFTGSSLETMDLGEGEVTGLFTRWIQHDALIQPGNSGGPLVNFAGEVVGINELGGGGMGFAIPANLARHVLNQALTFGEVRRGWLGVTVHPAQPLGREDGALVASVLPGGPMAEAGIAPGDVLLRVGNHVVNVHTFEDVPGFYATLADLRIGSEVGVVYEREGEQHTTRAKVVRMEPFRGEERVFSVWGVSAMAITPPMAFARNYPDTKGVLVTGIRPGKAPEVARPALQRGDVVLAIAGEEVGGLEDFGRLQEKYAAEKDLLVRFRRGRTDMVTALDMTRKPPDRRGRELAKAWLGVRTQVLTPEVARALGLPDRKGYRVTWVLPDTEAEKAGLRPGDVITHLDGEELQVWRLQDEEILKRRIEEMDIGADVTLHVIRDGQETDVTVTLEETPETATQARDATDEVLEYEVRELTYMDKVENRWPLDIQGLVVKKVESGGWANVAGLQAGDLILEIQGEPIRSIAEFKTATERIAEQKPKRVKLFVRRERATTFVFVEPDWPRE